MTEVTSKKREEQQAIMLFLEVARILVEILLKEGWKPTQSEVDDVEKAVVEYGLNYRKATNNDLDEWNIVLENYVLKRKESKQNGGNKLKRKLSSYRNKLYRRLKKIGVMEKYRRAPVFSIVITSYLNETEKRKSKRKKSILTRTNVVKYSYGYGSDHHKVFEEVIPL